MPGFRFLLRPSRALVFLSILNPGLSAWALHLVGLVEASGNKHLKYLGNARLYTSSASLRPPESRFNPLSFLVEFCGLPVTAFICRFRRPLRGRQGVKPRPKGLGLRR
jgi:hypothetical protein